MFKTAIVVRAAIAASKNITFILMLPLLLDSDMEKKLHM